MGSPETVAWRAKLKLKEAQMQASLRSGSSWMHRFQAAQRRASSSGASPDSSDEMSEQGSPRAQAEMLPHTVRARLREGGDANKLWREIKDALGESTDRSEIAKRGWELQRMACKVGSNAPPDLSARSRESTLLSSTHFALHTAQQERSEDDMRARPMRQVSTSSSSSSSSSSQSNNFNSADFNRSDSPNGFQPMSLDPPQLHWSTSQSTVESARSSDGMHSSTQGPPQPPACNMSLDPAPLGSFDFAFKTEQYSARPHVIRHGHEGGQQVYSNMAAHMKRQLSVEAPEPARLERDDDDQLYGYAGQGHCSPHPQLEVPQSAASNGTVSWSSVAASAAASADPTWDRTKRVRNL